MSVAELVAQVHALEDEEQTEFFASAFEGLKLIRVVGLVKHLEKRWDVEAKPDFGGLGQQQQVDEPEEVEQTEFDVIVNALGEKKMDAVKALRSVSGNDLKTANNTLKEALPTKVNKARKLSREEAEDWKKALEGAGCQIELK
jgi:large subunit ribosomal protein L7/L12